MMAVLCVLRMVMRKAQKKGSMEGSTWKFSSRHYWAATGGFVLRPVVCSGSIPALSASSRPQ